MSHGDEYHTVIWNHLVDELCNSIPRIGGVYSVVFPFFWKPMFETPQKVGLSRTSRKLLSYWQMMIDRSSVEISLRGFCDGVERARNSLTFYWIRTLSVCYLGNPRLQDGMDSLIFFPLLRTCLVKLWFNRQRGESFSLNYICNMYNPTQVWREFILLECRKS